MQMDLKTESREVLQDLLAQNLTENLNIVKGVLLKVHLVGKFDYIVAYFCNFGGSVVEIYSKNIENSTIIGYARCLEIG